jgi:hypothetical protein
MRKDTGHKIYTGSGCQDGEPYVLFGGGVEYGALRLVLVEIRFSGKVPCPPLYSPGGRVPSRLQGTSPSRITWNES